ncbi:MAG: 4-hydroxybenzoate polyprenyltransferase [Gammaproteobacteria bacterium]
MIGRAFSALDLPTFGGQSSPPLVPGQCLPLGFPLGNAEPETTASFPLKIPALLEALRPGQWVKNVFVLAPLVFGLADRQSEELAEEAVLRTVLALLAFCAASGAVYLLNDVVDAERDRKHPEKCKRPIASGRLSARTALLSAVCLAAAALVLGPALSMSGLSVVIGIYLSINLAYSFGLKQVVLVDVFCIAFGFLLRVHGGGVASGATISHWLYLCTLFLALFLALNKRRVEVVALGEDRGQHRPNLEEYSVGFLDQLTTVLAATTILCYTMYTVDSETVAKFSGSYPLVWTVPFVVFGIARYMLLVQTGRGGAEPARVLLGGDRLFLLNGLVWVAAVWLALASGS